MIKRITYTLLLLLLVVTCLVMFAPGVVYSGTQKISYIAAGFDKEIASIDGYQYAYLDNKNMDKPVLLLVHGVTADKDNWPFMSFFLKDDYRIIAIDLLGHGESSSPLDGDYRISAQAARVKAFMNQLGIEKFHMAGNSMGGHITAMYASRYPDDLLSAHLLNNAGVVFPNPSDLMLALEQGENPLVLESAADGERLVEYIFASPPPTPAPLVEYYAGESAKRYEINREVFKQIREEPFFEDLAGELPNITAPVQIIWGRQDRILDVSSIEVMEPLLEGEEIIVIENCGHTPMLEYPKQTANYIHSFISTL